MKKAKKDPAGFLPLPTATLHILLALGDGEMHGYAIMTEVERVSDGLVRMGPGTLYGSLKRMAAEGLVEETAGNTDPALDERRRYYRLTDLGERVCTAEVRRLRSLLSRSVLRRWSGALGEA